jgi:hypothetical protein
MPRLPDVEARPTPRPGRAIASYEGGAAARALGGMGEELGRIAERLDKDQAIDEALTGRRQLDEWERSARAKAAELKGAHAYTLTEDLSKEFDQTAAKVSQSLTNERAKKAFAEMSAARRAQVLDWASARVNHEREVVRTSEFNANVTTFIQNASDDHKRAAYELDNLTNEVRRYWGKQGLGDKDIAIKAREASDALHAGVVKSLLTAKNPVEAQKYFDGVKETLSVKVRGALDAEVRQVNDAIQVNDYVQKVWSEDGPKGANDAVRIADINARIMKDYGNDPDKMKLAKASIVEMTNAHNKQQSETNAAATNSVVEAYRRGVSRAALRALPAWREMPATKQQEMDVYFDNLAHQALARAQAADARAITALERKQREIELKTGGLYLDHLDHSKLSTMSIGEIKALEPTLGLRRTEHLLNVRQQMETKEGKLAVRLDQDTFNRFADEAGLKPFDTTKTEEQRRRLGWVRDAVDQEISAEQHRLKRELTFEEKRDKMRRVIDNKVMLDEWGRDPSVPLAMVTPEQMKTAYVSVNGKDIKLSNIPPAFIVSATGQLRAAGLQPTMQNIAEAYAKSLAFGAKVKAGKVSQGAVDGR